jgi:hypothetical protein
MLRVCLVFCCVQWDYRFRLLRDKTATDDEFVEFCKLRRGAARDTLETLLDLPVSSVMHKYHNLVDGIVGDVIGSTTIAPLKLRQWIHKRLFKALLGLTRYPSG